MKIVIEMDLPVDGGFSPKFGKHILEAFETFTTLIEAKEFSRNLRQMLFEFLKVDDISGYSYYDDLLADLRALFDLLDVMEDQNRLLLNGPAFFPDKEKEDV